MFYNCLYLFQADASLGMLEREYLRESLSYVLKIQEVQERIKFEFVETLLRKLIYFYKGCYCVFKNIFLFSFF